MHLVTCVSGDLMRLVACVSKFDAFGCICFRGP